MFPGHAIEVALDGFLPMELVEGEAGRQLTLICKVVIKLFSQLFSSRVLKMSGGKIFANVVSLDVVSLVLIIFETFYFGN